MEGKHNRATMLIFTLLFICVSFSNAERNGRCPPLNKWRICPEGALTCSQDSDCAEDMKCCESPCGNVCSKQLFTGCEHLQMAATRRARTLGSEGKSVRIPRCNSNGDFDPIQCDNEVDGHCWCVDEAGFELPGTRAPSRGLVNCTSPAACAAHTCRMLCPHGFKVAPDGCPICQCRDPCSDVKCPNKLTCQLEEVACLRQPCPPIPTCKRGRSLENICPVGEPLMITDTHRPFLCGNDPGKPTCPPLYQCLVQRGNDYGVCCPASLKIQKPGMCPSNTAVNSTEDVDCNVPCNHDLECPSMQKCCHSDACGQHCVFPENLTECLQQKALAEALSISERAGRGYIPQCSDKDGMFESRQCSRNGLVCWCVDKSGYKAKGSMGPAATVNCTKFAGEKSRSSGRSLSGSVCDRNICASICEYGFRVDQDGCPTCECDNPCEGFICKDGEECIPVKEQSCQEEFCPSYPVCQPKQTYVNPCLHDTPFTNDTTGDVINCDPNKEDEDCPMNHQCTPITKTERAVCCPIDDSIEEEDEDEDYDIKPGLCPLDINFLCHKNETVTCLTDNECTGDQKCCLSSKCGSICAEVELSEEEDEDDRSPTMCEYLRDFNEKMEGTHDGMKLALPTPGCFKNGSFVPTQCSTDDGVKQCWCVDTFGSEIPTTRGNESATVDCLQLRESSDCLELTCRLGCDYGFVISPDNLCPMCQCRNPCQDIACEAGSECQMVDVACDNDYCPPVPACLPQKPGQCPYLVPSAPGSCDYACQSDAQCGGSMRCCSNGCGTQCIEPVLKTACQHQQAILLHKASETGIPARQLYVPSCREEDGGYERVQCHHSAGYCWCVDEGGIELPGTRTKKPNQPKCQDPAECAKLNCEQKCDHGYELDSDGCTTCKCRDPCADMKCPNEGEICKVVNVQCITEPCPPVAMCVGGSELSACGGGSDGPARRCGPNEPPCPSSHKCHLSPLAGPSDDPPVCCPKPRSVCFEPKDEGVCEYSSSNNVNVTRWYFNPERNQCQQFKYGGCSGNHNNFQTEQICQMVCPVLSQCERLREKNQKAAIRYKKKTFTPKCRSDTGEWEPVQCMPHVDVCWCVNAKGEPLKGSIIRGSQPECNFRQARRRMDLSSAISSTDDVLEELVRQMTTYTILDSIDEIEPVNNNQLASTANHEIKVLKSRCLSTQEQLKSSSASYEATCDSSGRFTPTQCESKLNNAKCWCVDEAGNQLPGTSTFTKGDSICLPTPIEAVDVTLGFFGDFSDEISERMKTQILNDLAQLGATLKDNEIDILKEPDLTYIRFSIVGNNKVDVAYHLEELVKEEELALNGELSDKNIKMVADIKKSQFQHKLGVSESKNIAENKIIALQHREILSESTVSVVTTYHTAIIVLAAASAFVISTMSVLIMLYKKKVSSMGKANNIKVTPFNERFLPYEPPVYVLSKSEKEDLAEAMKINEKSLQSEKV